MWRQRLIVDLFLSLVIIGAESYIFSFGNNDVDNYDGHTGIDFTVYYLNFWYLEHIWKEYIHTYVYIFLYICYIYIYNIYIIIYDNQEYQERTCRIKR